MCLVQFYFPKKQWDMYLDMQLGRSERIRGTVNCDNSGWARLEGALTFHSYKLLDFLPLTMHDACNDEFGMSGKPLSDFVKEVIQSLALKVS